MDQLHKEKLTDRITYLVFSILLVAIMIFPMFSIKSVTGEKSTEVSSSVTSYQIMKVAFSSEEELSSRKTVLNRELSELVDKLEKEGKTDEKIAEELKTNSLYNEYMLIQIHEFDKEKVVPFAVFLLISYILAGVLVIMYGLTMILRKDKLDLVNFFITAAMAAVVIVATALSFSLTYTINTNLSHHICGSMMLYAYTVLTVAFAVFQLVRIFILKRARKVKENEVTVPFTAEEK